MVVPVAHQGRAEQVRKVLESLLGHTIGPLEQPRTPLIEVIDVLLPPQILVFILVVVLVVVLGDGIIGRRRCRALSLFIAPPRRPAVLSAVEQSLRLALAGVRRYLLEALGPYVEG